MAGVKDLQAQEIIEQNTERGKRDKTSKENSDKLAKAVLMMTALRMQEREETREEIADYIYEYKGKAMSGGSSLLCPGDHMVLNAAGNSLGSARGATIALDTSGLEKLLESGALDKTFSMDDLSSPDFTKKLDAVLDNMAMQAEYRDAYSYCEMGDESGLASFAKDVASNTPTAIVIRNGSEFAVAAGSEIKDDIKDIAVGAADAAGEFVSDAFGSVRECTYEEFNPGGLDIRSELESSVNGERENPGEKFERLRDRAAENGNNKAKAIDSAPSKGASAFAALSAAAAGDPEKQQQAENDISPLANSRAMRRMNIE